LVAEPPRRSARAADERLARAAAIGDGFAFEALMRRHESAAYRVAVRMLGRPADAEEAVQDAFVAAWRALPGFRGQSRFSTWMHRITVNRCLTVIAGRRPLAAPLSGAEADPGHGPLEAAAAREGTRAVTAAIECLTPEQRAPFVLRELEGLSYDEIGEVLDLSPAAVKGRLHRARLELVEAVRPWR